MDPIPPLLALGDAPLSFRFVVQPALALLLGLRDGRMDVRAGRRPFFLCLFEPGRRNRLTAALRAIAVPFAMAIAADALVQQAVSGRVRIDHAVVIGFLLIAVPYVAARGLSNRAISRSRRATR